MHELVDQQPLSKGALPGEILAIGMTLGMEVHVSARSHGDTAGLEGKPFAPPDGDAIIVDGVTKDRAGQGDFAGGQRAFTPDRAASRFR